MLGVPAVVTVQVIAHVDQFLSDDDFQRLRFRAIDARQVDEDGMLPDLRKEDVRTSK
jgi:hypothetical protein